MNFEESLEKSLNTHQYSCCGHRWWKNGDNSKCNECQQTCQYLSLEETVGIGWFECLCGRKFAGFCRGDVASRCHKCDSHILPSFIVPGKKIKRKTDDTHECDMCDGSGECPIVDDAHMD